MEHAVHVGGLAPSRFAAVRLACVLVLAFLLGWAAPSPVGGQPLPCLDCDFEVSVVVWSGQAVPDAVVNGTLRITNTGGTQDSYTITVAADNESWQASVEPATIEDVPPGQGVLASDANSATFDVGVVVPEGARAGHMATVNVTVQSTRDPDLTEQEILEATTEQVYAWGLACTDTLEVMKSKRGVVELVAENRGNGPDRAQIAFTPVEGVVVEGVRDVDAAPGASATQQVDVGVGLRAEDGNHTIRWDLRSKGDTEVTADCATTFTIRGGTDDDGGTGQDDEESPAPATFATVLALLLVGSIAARRRS